MEAATTEVRPLPQIAEVGAIERARTIPLAQVVGALALLGILAGTLLVVIAAAQGDSDLSGSVVFNSPHWLTWPFRGFWQARTNDHTDLLVGELVVMVAMFACYGVAIYTARVLHPAIVWGTLIAVGVVCFLSPPLLLTDTFNYIGYARMGVVHHLNPYTHLPIAIKGDPVFRFSNWHHLPSPYGPLFSLGTYALAPLSVPVAYWVYKASVMFAMFGCLVLVAMIARRLGRNPLVAVVIVGLNPLVLLYGSAGQHNDAFVMLFVLGAVYYSLVGRERLGGFAMVGAAAMKASGILLIPALALAARRRDRSIIGVVIGAVVFGAVTLAGFGPHLPAIGIQGRMASPLSIPSVLGLIAGRGGSDAAVRAVMDGVLVIATIGTTIWAYRRRDLVAAIGWLTVFTLATLSWDMAWYVLWLLPFIAFVPSRRFRIAAIAVVVYMTIQWLPLITPAAHSIGFNPTHTKTWRQNQAYLGKYLK